MWIHTIYFMMQGKNRETYTRRSWLSSSRMGGGRCSGGDGQCIHINKRGARSQWGEIQVTVCHSRVRCGLWGGELLAMMDVWIQWWRWIFGRRLIGDMRSYVGLKGRETQPPGGDGRWYVVMWRWCDSKYAQTSGHSEKKRSIRVGTHSGKWHTKQQGGRSKKTQV